MTLADRMKRYEHTERRYLPRRTYTLLRLDGRAFHTYTRGMDRPFDIKLMAAMDKAAISLCEEIQGVKFAYVQSDEISLLLTDFEAHETEPWMGGNLQKLVSLSASIATASFNAARAEPQVGPLSRGLAHFDSRVWTIADPNEVANYFIWRQRDCVKNSITMVAQSHFTPAELNGLNSSQRQDALHSVGVNWNDFPDGQKRGRVVSRDAYHLETALGTTVLRHRWTVKNAPHFMIDVDSWLVEHVPPMPALPADI